MRAGAGARPERLQESVPGGPVDLWTTPSGRPAPSGARGQAVDDARASPTALPTLAGLSPTSSTGQQQQPFLFMDFKEGEPDEKKRLTGGGLIRATWSGTIGRRRLSLQSRRPTDQAVAIQPDAPQSNSCNSFHGIRLSVSRRWR